MAAAMENNITANTEQEQADKNTKMDKTDLITTEAASLTTNSVEKQVPMNVEKSLTMTASQTQATTAKSMKTTTKNSTNPLASQVTVQSVNNTTPLNPSSTLPLPQRPPGRARTGSAEARPFSARGVPPGCFNSIQSVSRLSLGQGIRDLAQERS